MNLPNWLTIIRISLIPFFIAAFYLPFHASHFLSACIFAVAALTDWLDGYLARSLKLTSSFGAFLDPVADKLITATALVLLVSQKDLPYLAIPAIVIISREILVSALREWMAEIGKGRNLPVSLISKVKTVAQMLAITLLLAYSPIVGQLWLALLGYLFLYSATLLTLWSMYLYLKTAWQAVAFR